MARVPWVAMATAAVLGVLALEPGAAGADLPAAGRRLIAIEAESSQLEKDVAAIRAPTRGTNAAERRFIEGEVAFGMRNWATASIVLYDVVEKYPKSRSYRQAVFLLGEALYQKRDYLTARDYFRKVVFDLGETAPHYQDALQRLLDIALVIHDTSDVREYLDRLDRIPEARRVESAPYARGKYEYFSGNHDAALKAFRSIPSSSRYGVRARYFIGVTQVARHQLPEAIATLEALMTTRPAQGRTRIPGDARVFELARLALGRLYYESDKPAKAIEQYRQVPRKSEFFDEAMTEIAWVYVKAGKYDRALRALELLALADQGAAQKPALRILQGNLSIHRAQSMVDQGTGNATEAYRSASDIFDQLRDTYEAPRDALKRLVERDPDPAKFFALLTSEGSKILQTELELPELAVKWARQDQDVRRMVVVSEDVTELRSEIDASSELLTRLERGVGSRANVNMFPDLASRRFRALDLGERAQGLRRELVDAQAKLIDPVIRPAERSQLDKLQQQRAALTAELAVGGGATTAERVRRARARVEALDRRAQEVEVLIGGLEAEIRALERYHDDTAGTPAGATLSPVLYEGRMRDLKAEVATLRETLTGLRSEITLAMDAAGLGDEDAQREVAARKSLDETVRAEQALIDRVAARLGGEGKARAAEIRQLTMRLEAVDSKLVAADRRIDTVLDARLVDTRKAIAEERARIEDLKRELAETEVERGSLGGDVAVLAFSKLTEAFSQVLVRAELGIVDVAWAQMEDAKREQTRVSFEASRARRVLEEEFKDVEEDEQAPASTGGGQAPAPTDGEQTPAPSGDQPAAPTGGAQAPAGTGGTPAPSATGGPQPPAPAKGAVTASRSASGGAAAPGAPATAEGSDALR